MANTNTLKMVVEKEIIELFCKKHKIDLINISKNKVRSVFNMEPDLIGYNAQQKTLYLGEITTSGYLGQHGKDFHIGAVKKVYEAFAKFFLIYYDKAIMLERLYNNFNKIEMDSIECYFIVPEGSKFINALGYRTKLFRTGYMKLETIRLTEKTKELMIKALINSKEEIQVNKR